MPDDLYIRDALVWSEQQAELLSRLARGERVNDSVDWANVIEEVRDVGLSQLSAVESLIRQAFVHLLKMRGWPDGPVNDWGGETVGFLSDAQSRFTPSMRQRIDLTRAYRRALHQVRQLTIDGRGPADLPPQTGLSLEELLAEEIDVALLAAKVG